MKMMLSFLVLDVLLLHILILKIIYTVSVTGISFEKDLLGKHFTFI